MDSVDPDPQHCQEVYPIEDIYIKGVRPEIFEFGFFFMDLKGHGNEPNFPSFLHKSLWPRSPTLHFEPF